MTREQMKLAHAENIQRAADFAERFNSIKVTSCGTKEPGAMAAHHNKETGWGFTVQFITTPDHVNHIHAYTEYVGKAGDEEAIAEQFKKVVGG